MTKKYEFTKETKEYCGITLKQIRRLSDGLVGGWLESESNLSHKGNAWVSGSALISGSASVYGDALVSGDTQVYGDASVYDSALISGNASVYGSARISGNASISEFASVYGSARVHGSARVSGNASVYGSACVYGFAKVYSPKDCNNLSNLRFNLTLTPTLVFAGCRQFTREEFLNLTLDQCQEEWEEWELENYKGYGRLFYERLDRLDSGKAD